MNKAQELYKKLHDLGEERNELMVRLAKSLAIQELWPNAFRNGNPTAQVVGNIRKSLEYTITFPDGTTDSMPLEDVPVILWPQKVKDDLKVLSPYNKYNKVLLDVFLHGAIR